MHKTRTAPAIIGVLALGLMLTACTTFESNTGKSIATIANTVEAARKSWVDYVTKQRTMLAGNPAELQKLEVNVAKGQVLYEQYQTVMRAANAALTAYHFAPSDQSKATTALKALSAAAGDIIALINSIMGTTTTPK